MSDPINLSNIPVKTIGLSNEIQRVKHSIKPGGPAFFGQRDAELKDTSKAGLIQTQLSRLWARRKAAG